MADNKSRGSRGEGHEINYPELPYPESPISKEDYLILLKEELDKRNNVEPETPEQPLSITIPPDADEKIIANLKKIDDLKLQKFIKDLESALAKEK